MEWRTKGGGKREEEGANAGGWTDRRAGNASFQYLPTVDSVAVAVAGNPPEADKRRGGGGSECADRAATIEGEEKETGSVVSCVDDQEHQHG